MMKLRAIMAASLLCSIAGVSYLASTASADGDITKVKHIVIVMQENHSFDNYFGVLPYDPASPYHAGTCKKNDHACVDGLSCMTDNLGNLKCTNSNDEADGSSVVSFHDANYCPGPDLQHNWPGSHAEANLNDPAAALLETLNNGFVVVNDLTEQIDTGGESATEDDTMGYYNQDDLPFYYALAETFAIDDRFFCSVVGPTFPNRSYEMAATSFGHLTTDEIFPPLPPLVPFPGGYMPITGTIFDLLDAAGISWINYFQDLPTSAIFRGDDPTHLRPIGQFFNDSTNGTLPPVSFIDPSFFPDQSINGGTFETDEHPPFDIRAGQYFVSTVVNAFRNSTSWKDSVLFLTYDEHGGFFDHVPPPRAPQGGALNPDGINPGQCADLSNPPSSTQPGGGLQCTVSQSDAASICLGFSATGAYPASCANFDQLGFRVPFIVVSPFAKPHYVSHTVGDHTSMLAFIERRFLAKGNGNAKGKAVGGHQSLTLRDLNADPLLDMFDFVHSPSLNAPPVPAAPKPVVGEHDCP